MARSGRDPLRIALSYLWALSPVLTFGLAAPIVFVFAAARRKAPALWLACAIYTSSVVVWMATVDIYDPVFYLALAISTLAATGHALAIRPAVFLDQSKPNPMELAIDAEKKRRRLRSRARELAANDPALALELRIGRPDLPRSYDDGGVVDVNHAPADILTSLPGVTHEHAELIVRLREQQGGFVSANELCVLAELPAEITTAIAEQAVFLPYRAPSS